MRDSVPDQPALSVASGVWKSGPTIAHPDSSAAASAGTNPVILMASLMTGFLRAPVAAPITLSEPRPIPHGGPARRAREIVARHRSRRYDPSPLVFILWYARSRFS